MDPAVHAPAPSRDILRRRLRERLHGMQKLRDGSLAPVVTTAHTPGDFARLAKGEREHFEKMKAFAGALGMALDDCRATRDLH